ncbi:hypothetical protein J6590_019591 [Homalodisca vitripennis]|nr:hypothetical protein J6590_019591 [Homalodisca vitripennis]
MPVGYFRIVTSDDGHSCVAASAPEYKGVSLPLGFALFVVGSSRSPLFLNPRVPGIKLTHRVFGLQTLLCLDVYEVVIHCRFELSLIQHRDMHMYESRGQPLSFRVSRAVAGSMKKRTTHDTSLLSLTTVIAIEVAHKFGEDISVYHTRYKFQSATITVTTSTKGIKTQDKTERLLRYHETRVKMHCYSQLQNGEFIEISRDESQDALLQPTKKRRVCCGIKRRESRLHCYSQLENGEFIEISRDETNEKTESLLRYHETRVKMHCYSQLGNGEFVEISREEKNGEFIEISRDESQDCTATANEKTESLLRYHETRVKMHCYSQRGNGEFVAISREENITRRESRLHCYSQLENGEFIEISRDENITRRESRLHCYSQLENGDFIEISREKSQYCTAIANGLYKEGSIPTHLNRKKIKTVFVQNKENKWFITRRAPRRRLTGRASKER